MQIDFLGIWCPVLCLTCEKMSEPQELPSLCCGPEETLKSVSPLPALAVTQCQAQREEIPFLNFNKYYISLESVAQNLHPEFINVQLLECHLSP